MSVSELIKKVSRVEVVTQSLGLIAAQGIGMLLSFALTMVIARGLGVASYGEFRYVITFLTLGMTILQFGVPYSIARLLAIQSESTAEQSIIGASIVLVAVSTIVGVVLTASIVGAGEVFGYTLPSVLIWTAPALCVTLGQLMINSVCQGLGHIWTMAIMQVLPYLILLPITLLQVYALNEYSLVAAIISYVAAFIVAIVVVFTKLSVRFADTSFWLKSIIRENRRTGFPIYIGGLFAVTSAQFITMWVAEVSGAVEYGQYALAVGVAGPLGILVSSIGTVIFRSSARSRRFSRRFMLLCGSLVVSLALLFYAATEFLLVPAFGEEFAPSVRMARWLGCASLIIGWGDVFQRFLGAHGFGKRLGTASTIAGIVGIGAAVILIKDWTVNAAIAASLATAVVYYSSMVALYLLFTREHSAEPSSIDLDNREKR